MSPPPTLRAIEFDCVAQILLALGKNSSEIRTEFEEPLKSYIDFNITSAY